MKYKQSGIYCYRNKINNKKYVGQSVDLVERKRDFFVRNKMYSGKIFQNAIEKYGRENFEYSILTHCKPEELNFFEAFYISRLKTTDRKYGYNATTGGDSFERTEDCRKHMAESWTDERRKKISEKLSGENNGFYHHKHDEATIELLKKHKKECDEKRFFERYGYNISELVKRVEKYILKNNNPTILDIRKEFKISQRIVYKVCNKIGYNSKKAIEHLRDKTKKTVVQCDRNNHDIILNVFPSISYAKECTNIKSINGCLNGSLHNAGGYFWRIGKEGEKFNGILNEEYLKPTGLSRKLDEKTKKELKERGVWDKSYRYKTVYRYGRDGKLEKTYPSVKSVELDGFVPCDVCNCCNDKVKTNKGFVFSYTELSKEDVVSRFIDPRKKPIIQMSKENDIIKTWDCASTAAKELGLTFGNISACCYGKIKTCGGYKWRFSS